VFVRARSSKVPAASGIYTGSDGSFNIVLIPSTDYKISTFSKDYASVFYKRGANKGTTTRYDEATLIDITGGDYVGIGMDLDPGSSINGFVLKKEKGQYMNPTRILNANIFAVSEKENWVGSTKSSSDGSYVINAPKADDIIVYYLPSPGDNYVKAYYKARTYSVYQAGQASSIDVTDGMAYGVNLFMLDGTVLSGSVLDDNSEPVSNVLLSAWSSDFTQHEGLISEQDGKFSFVVLPGNNYIISAYLPEYGEFFFNHYKTVTSMDKAALIETYQKMVTGLDITMVRGNSISGRVYDGENKPLEGAFVNAYSEISGNGGKATTDEHGKYKITIPAGDTYKLWCYSYGKPDSFYIASGLPTTKWENGTFVSTSKGNMENIDILIPKSRIISGSLLGDNQTPLVGKWVMAYSLSTGETGFSVTDAGGKYLVALPPRKDYVIYAFPAEKLLGCYYSLESQGTTELQKATKVDIENTAGNAKNIYLRSGVKVSGRIENQSGVGLGDAWIVAFSQKTGYLSGAFSSTFEADKGYFSLSLFPTDDYILEVFPKRGLHCYLGGSITEDKAEVLDATNDVSNIAFSIDRGNTVSGYIVCKQNNGMRGVSGANVLVYSPESHVTGLTRSGVDGRYSVEVPPGDTYVVYAWSDSYPPKYYPDTWWEESALSLDLSLSNAKNVHITLEKGCNISGKILNTFLDNEKIYVSALSRGRDFKTRVEADGTYVLENLPPTKDNDLSNLGYFVMAFSENLSGEYYNLSGGTFEKEKASRLNLKSGENAENIDFYLEEGGKIYGNFTAQDNLTGEFWVTLKSVSGSSFEEKKRILSSGTSGSFTFNGLPLGVVYKVSVFATDFENTEYKNVKLTAEDKEHSLPTITLTKGVSLSGVVRDTNGTPIYQTSVSVLVVSEGSIFSVTSDLSGKFEIKGLDKNKEYRIKVYKKGFVPYGGFTDSENTYSVSSSKMDIVLKAGFKISGVVSENSRVLKSIYISLCDSDGKYIDSSISEKDGSFQFDSYFSAGVYELKVFRNGENKTVKSFSMSSSTSHILEL